MSQLNVNSALVADIGSVHTRLVLIDMVEGQYRLVSSSRARSTAAPPLGSVSAGLERAAERISEMTGRQLISPDPEQMLNMPEINGHGVDEFLATASVGRPMRVFVVGLTPEVSLASARRMLAGSYISITDTLSLDDRRGEEDQINAVLSGDPDLILIVGGTNDGAQETLLAQVHVVERALSLVQGSLPVVLYAGNEALRRHVNAILSPLTRVFFARNVRPTTDQEQLFPAQIELAMVYDDYRSRSPGGFNEIGRHSQVGVVPTTQGYISTMRYLSELSRRGVGPLLLDVGSANSAIVAGLRPDPSYRICTDIGVGHSIVSTLEQVTPQAVLRWLPFESSEDRLWDYVHNKALRPATVPGTTEELQIEQAIAREVIRLLVAQSRPDWDLGRGEMLPPFDPIIAAGAVLTGAQHPGISVLMLLDALQPAGMPHLYADPHNLLSSVGVLAYLNPLMTVQVLDTGGLVSLGTAFCPDGRVRDGRDAMYVHVRVPDGPVINKTVRGGEIWMAPILPGTQAAVQVRLQRGLSINGKRRLKLTVEAGAAGIIFDARGRPLVMPRAKDRAVRLAAWQVAMSGLEGQVVADEEIPDLADLVPAAETDK